MTNYHRHDMLNSSRNCNTIIRIYELQSRTFFPIPSYLRTSTLMLKKINCY